MARDGEGATGFLSNTFLWRGLLGAEKRSRRILCFVVLAIVSFSLTFLQLGFVDFGGISEGSGYAIGLLGPLASAALLLGPLNATILGLLSGATLWAHAKMQPLDLYEAYCVSPYNSAVLLAVVGLLMGVLLAIGLRIDPQNRRRNLIFAGVSLVAAACTVFLFAQLAPGRFTSGSALSAELNIQHLVESFSQGSPVAQVVYDTVLCLAFLVATDIFTTLYYSGKGKRSVRADFRARLLAVLILVFLLMASLTFATTTQEDIQEAHEAMRDKAEYIGYQLGVRTDYLEYLAVSPDLKNISIETYDTIARMTTFESAIGGLNIKNEGIVAVFCGPIMLSTNNPKYDPYTTFLENIFGEYAVKYFQETAARGGFRLVLYSEHPIMELLDPEVFRDSNVQMGYLEVLTVPFTDDPTYEGEPYYVAIMRPASLVFSDRSSTMSWMVAHMLAIMVAAYAIASFLLHRYLIRPIDHTNGSLAKITAGDLNEVVNERENLEFASLSDGINATVNSLKDYAAESARRIERDLATAKAIQEGALPRSFPAFPEIDAFDIYASMNAAREVGGDFYDFFLIDDHTLGFLIADVSGKGIPGALFMMAAKAELDNYMSTGMDLAQAVKLANETLCANNEAGMFVTVWAATLDFETGEVTYVNAGHNFPLLRHGLNGPWEWLTEKCGLFLGTFEFAKYRSKTLQLQPGDELILYTDGVNEAFSVGDEEYGNDRLEAFLAEHVDLRPRELVEKLRASVAKWAEGAEQSDDITILALEYKGSAH